VRKAVILALIVAALVQASVRPASAQIGSVAFANETGACAWITVYRSSGMIDGWHIMDGPYNRPRFVRPGEKWSVNSPPNSHEIKVRGELTQNADCSGPILVDVYAVYKRSDSSGTSRIDAYLRRGGDRYWMLIPGA
jgi:hypothetical protein